MSLRYLSLGVCMLTMSFSLFGCATADCGRLCDEDFWDRGSSRSASLADVKAELNRGASVKGKDVDGRTPLHWAAGYAEHSVVEFLLDENADVNAKSSDGRTPLHWASNNPVGIDLLTNQGADVDAKEDLGMTPLHYAVAGSGNIYAIDLLLDRGADVDAKDDEGMTPLHWAVSRDAVGVNYDGPRIVALLLGRGADINASMNTGATPCQIAMNAGQLISYEALHLVCGR